MPELKLVHGHMLHVTTAPEETSAVCRIHCEAEFTAAVASFLKIDGPSTWPKKWKGPPLDIKDIPVTMASFMPTESMLPGLTNPVAVSVMTSFRLKLVERNEETRKVITFSLKTANHASAVAAMDWIFSRGEAESTITITHPTQTEIKEMQEKESGQMSIGDAQGVAAEAIKIVKGKAN